MSVRSDGFMSEDELLFALDLDPRILARVLPKVGPSTKRASDSALLYYGPDTIARVEDWLIIHPEYLEIRNWTDADLQWSEAQVQRSSLIDDQAAIQGVEPIEENDYE